MSDKDEKYKQQLSREAIWLAVVVIPLVCVWLLTQTVGAPDKTVCICPPQQRPQHAPVPQTDRYADPDLHEDVVRIMRESLKRL